MLLGTLLAQLEPGFSAPPDVSLEITGIYEDSRAVQPGGVFIARGGTRTDGSRFIADAKLRGAVAVVTDAPVRECPLPQVVVADAAEAGSRLAQAFYGWPARRLRMIGVTGTNGKTTTTYLLRHLLSHTGRRCGMIGTVETDDGLRAVESSMTTPGSPEVAALLGRMVENNCHACAMEVSSHALDQRRVAGVDFAAGVFTNLTGDHLDYHGSMERYAAAKARLFESLGPGAVAVVNGNDRWSAAMTARCVGRVVRFGFTRDCDYWARDIGITAHGSGFVLVTPDGEAPVRMKLIGRHNIENVLAASATAGEAFGLSVHQIAAGLREAPGAPGRLQAVSAGQPFAVLVDYAHTDDALRNVLTALRPLTRGRLRVLFGCGGDRDRTKRPRMAAAAVELADAVYVTSDNPRTEDPRSIIEQIVAGIPAENTRPVVVQPDRRRAIEQILRDAGAEDVVLIAGKGHENYQIIGTMKHHFDDTEEAGRVLGAQAGMKVG